MRSQPALWLLGGLAAALVCTTAGQASGTKGAARRSAAADSREPRFHRGAGSAALSCPIPCTTGDMREVRNPYYGVTVDCDTGAFNAGTGPGHPVGPDVNVIYGWETLSTGTSDISFHVHDTATTYTDPTPGSTCAFDPPDTPEELSSFGLESEWSLSPLPGVNLTLRQEVVAFGDSLASSGFRLTLCAFNDALSSGAVSMGVRWNIDHRQGPDDGPVFSTLQCEPFMLGPAITSEQEILPADLRDYSLTAGNGSDPMFDVYWSTSALSGIAGTGRPDRLVWRDWDGSDPAWDYVVLTGTPADEDSTALYYFGAAPADGIALPPGASFCRSVVAFTELPCDSGCLSPPVPLELPNTLRAHKDLTAVAAALSWMTSDPAAVAFRIHRGPDKVPPYPLHPSAGDLSATSYADGVLGDGSSYYYQVTAVNCLGVEGP